MCLIIFLGAQGTREKIAWVQNFPHVKLERAECIMTSFMQSVFGMWMAGTNKRSSVLLKHLCFSCTPISKGLWDRVGIFSKL